MSTAFITNRPISVDSELPAQSAATTNRVLISNGSSSLWAPVTSTIGTGLGLTTPSALFNAIVPSQAGNAGKTLSTDGTNTSWTTIIAGVSSFNSRTGNITLTAADVSSAGGALLASPVLTGNPTAPTPAAGDNDTSIATTAFVQTAISTYAQTSTRNSQGSKTISTSAPTGYGTPGDLWYVV